MYTLLIIKIGYNNRRVINKLSEVKMHFNSLGEMVRYYRYRLGLTQEELSKIIGLSRVSLMQIERDKTKHPKYGTLVKLSEALGIELNELINQSKPGLNPKNIENIKSNIVPIKQNPNKRYVKVLGSVPAGLPQEAYENDTGEVIEVDEDFITNNNELIALTVTGDSMYPRFIEGDIIILEVTNNYKNGDIVIATINDYETTLKQIYTNGNITTLHPINPEYPDRRYSFEHDRLSIFGVVRELRRKV